MQTPEAASRCCWAAWTKNRHAAFVCGFLVATCPSGPVTEHGRCTEGFCNNAWAVAPWSAKARAPPHRGVADRHGA